MKKKVTILLCLLMAVGTPVCAQGLLKKLKNAVEKELKPATGNAQTEKAPGSNNSTAPQQPVSDALKGLYRGNFGTDAGKETLITIHETAATKKIVLDEVPGTECGDFSCGLAFINTPKNGSFYINEQGEKVFSVSEQSIYKRADMEKMKFGDNRVIDCIEKENGGYVYKAVLYDNQGKVVKQLANIEKATNFVNGVAVVRTHPVRLEDKPVLKYINTKGEFVFPHLNIAGWYKELVIRPLCDGLAAYPKVSKDGVVWGFRNADGKEVVPATYKQVLDFSDGMAAVCSQVGEVDKWGYIDTTGKLVVPLTYTVQPKSFFDGYAVVCNKNQEQFFIDKTGTIVKGPFKDQERISSFHNGYALLRREVDGRAYAFVVDKSFNEVAYFDNFPYGYESDGEVDYDLRKYFFSGGYIILLDTFGTLRYTFLSQKGDLIYDNLCSDFCEDKALYITDRRSTAEKSCYVNRKGEILVQFVENEF